jgi:hypothetical protein
MRPYFKRSFTNKLYRTTEKLNFKKEVKMTFPQYILLICVFKELKDLRRWRRTEMNKGYWWES